ncbi:SGNH/GDSL hydrolase family protein [Elusimicrobiota bacterium]
MKFKKTIYFLIIYITILFIIDIVIDFTDLDIKILRKTLYTESLGWKYDHGKEIFRDAEDPELLYELNPGVKDTHRSGRNPKDTNKKPVKISINEFGFRDKSRKKEKPPDTYRIVILGGSNTFGPTVDDDETYPDVMEELLNSRNKGKFEVWNAGLNAYVLSQKVLLAEKIINDYNPDMLIFQLANTGRRAFFGKTVLEGGDLKYFFKRNKNLYMENIPCLISDNKLVIKIHYYFVSHWQLYRVISTVINTGVIALSRNTGFFKNIEEKYRYYGDVISERYFRSFAKKHKNNKNLIIVKYYPGIMKNIPKKTIIWKEDDYGIPELYINASEKPEIFGHLHPPAYVYKWHAAKIISALSEKNFF